MPNLDKPRFTKIHYLKEEGACEDGMSNALRIAHGEFGRVALLDMDRSLVRHAHPHCHVLLKVEGADTHFSVSNQLVPLDDDTAVLINAWEPHAYVHDPERPRTIILALYIEPTWLRCFRPNWAASGAPGFFEQPVGMTSPRIRALTHELALTMVHEPEAGDRQEKLLSELMIAVIERFTPWRTVSMSYRDLAAGRIDWRIRRAVNRVRAQPGERIDIDSLAREVGLSRPHFFRLFDRSFGLTPRVYFNVLRMELAVASVVLGDDSFASVSDRLGFSAPAHFTRFFRDHAGTSPSEFRNVARLGAAGA